MANANPPPKRPDVGRSPRGGNQRMAFRIIGLPILAVLAVYLFNGLRDYFALPACDSERAKQSLSEVLKQLQLEPLRYEPIKTISSGKEEVVCSAVLPLPDGASVVADYSFYWQGIKANMKYSISRKAASSTSINRPHATAYRSLLPSASG